MKKPLLISILLVLLIAPLSACSGGGGSITIGAQTYTETKVLAHMYKELIEESTDVSVDIKSDLATSEIVIKAMQGGEIQMSTQYTGTALSAFFSIKHPKDSEATLRQAKKAFSGEKFNFKWFDSLGYANTYAFTVRSDIAEKYNLEKISDLKDIAGEMTAGFDTTWLEREVDGYDAFVETYGFEFGKTHPMTIGLVYTAVKNKELDIALAYSTDARIKAYNLVALEDNKHFFPPYDASPVITQEALDKYPEIADAIKPLLGTISEETIRGLNAKVDLKDQDIDDVAIEYLKSQGLLE